MSTRTLTFSGADLRTKALAVDDDKLVVDATGNVQVGTANLFVDTQTGSVGVGTTEPAYKLDVATTGNPSTSIVNLTGLRLYNDNYYVADTNEILFKHGSNAGEGQAKILSYLPGSNDVDMRFHTTNNASLNTTPNLTLTGDGNVGIGTTNPTSKLYIQDDNADTKITIRGGGSTVNDSNVTIQLLETASSFYGGAVQYSGTSAIQGLRFGHYVVSSTPRIDMAIDRGTGNVGIGTTIPDEKLVVNGGFQVGHWKTKTWYGDAIDDGQKDVTLITHDGTNTTTGVMKGEVTVMVHRGGYNQQNAYAKFHVGYSYWSSAWQGGISNIHEYKINGVSAISMSTSGNSIIVSITGNDQNGAGGQYYIKFEGPIFNGTQG